MGRFSLAGLSVLVMLMAGQIPGRTGPAVSRGALPQDVTDPAVKRVQARYAAFKGGRKMWGTGIGRKIAFTFDDGPHYRTTPRLLDHLDVYGVKATFFINSSRANQWGLLTGKSYMAMLETHRRGPLLANHTHAHPHLNATSAEQQRRQIMMTQRMLRRVTGAESFLFRPPYGAMSKFAQNLLQKQGSTVVMWNIGSDDDKMFSVSRVLTNVMEKLRIQGGGILLFHDTHYWTVEAVPHILQAIRIESCKQLARGEEPWEVVGLEYFWEPRGGRKPPPSAAQIEAWSAKRAALRKLCNTQPKVALPAFIRGESS